MFQDFVKLIDSFSKICFFEKNHKYTIDGKPAKCSVSQLIKKYEKDFDSDKISKQVAIKQGVTQRDILRKWDFERDYSCHKGSEFHRIVENHFNNKKVKINRDLLNLFFKDYGEFKNDNYVQSYYNDIANYLKNFFDFYEWWKKEHILIKSEFIIGDSETGVCGTIDNLSFNKKTKELVIFDYKTNKSIKTKNLYGEMFLNPLNHLDKCEFNKYSLQLSLYSVILEKITSFTVPKSYIVWVNGNDGYELMECMDLKKESNIILNYD
jgi:ATP-dependent exoDNAse (exonuclease V) beta subunit